MQKIAIHSVPRSGSTWLGSIFDSNPNVAYRYQPLFSYSFKSFLDERSSEDQIQEFFYKIRDSDDDFINQNDKKTRGIIPEFIKDEITHVVYKEVRYHHLLGNILQQASDIKVILLIRNPLSTISSWLNAPREFRKDLGWNELEEWKLAEKKNSGKKEEYNGYEKWKEATHLFLKLNKEYPNQTRIIQYSDLLEDTIETVETLFYFCNLKFSEQTINFLNKSRYIQQEDAYSVYKKKQRDDDWKQELHPEIIQSIQDDLRGTELEQYI